tara:strand:- start:134 stop:682 length:549 start_codon:yes stop_codon:yes gene_type:complete
MGIKGVWKKIPYWIKWGLIFFVLGFIVILFFRYTQDKYLTGMLDLKNLMKFVVPSLIIFTISGFIIGLVVGKIRKIQGKSWLKGGLISGTIVVILTSIITLVWHLIWRMPSFGIFKTHSFFPTLTMLIKFLFLADDLPGIFVLLALFIFGFGIGALIGWIIGRVKSKKLIENPNNPGSQSLT